MPAWLSSPFGSLEFGDSEVSTSVVTDVAFEVDWTDELVDSFSTFVSVVIGVDVLIVESGDDAVVVVVDPWAGLVRLSPGNAPAAAMPPNASAQIAALIPSAVLRVTRRDLGGFTGAIVRERCGRGQHPRCDLAPSLLSSNQFMVSLTIL